MRVMMSWSLCIFFTFFAPGCATHADATPVRGPDGSDGWFVVRCKDDPKACSAEAESVCPQGFDTADDFERQEFEATHPGTRDGKLVHCRTMR